jgi:hypothetical protein
MTTIENLRQFRLGKYAIFDFAASFLGVYLLSPLLSKIFLKIGLNIPKQNWLFLTLPLSILTHLLVGNITPMTKDFFSPNSHYLLKLIILTSLFLGLKGIKLVK